METTADERAEEAFVVARRELDAQHAALTAHGNPVATSAAIDTTRPALRTSR
jgi:hypothetical protein